MTLRDKRQKEFADVWLKHGMYGILLLAPRFGKIRTSIHALEKVKPESILIAYPDNKIKESWQADFEELKLLVSSTSKEKIDITQYQKISLPKEYKSLLDTSSNSIIRKHALVYLKKRGITEYDIVKYNIGYCETGPYRNRIIIPSYDKNGVLNYFTGRTFEPENPIKYKNPQISRDIIPFELFINWNLPLILCEGPLDAVAIKRNAIPLLGKTIQPNIMKKIVTSSVKKIYIALDKDAINQALNFCEQLLNEGKEIYLVETGYKDPSELGFEQFTKLIQKTYNLTFSDLFEKKLYAF